MKETVLTMVKQNFEVWAETQMDGNFGEALRHHIFGNNGIVQVPNAVQEKLIEELKSSVKEDIEKKDRKGFRRKR